MLVIQAIGTYISQKEMYTSFLAGQTHSMMISCLIHIFGDGATTLFGV